jgi:hypothetical protein
MGKKKKAGLEAEFITKKHKKPSIFSQLKDYVQPQTQKVTSKAPVTFNVGLAVILFFLYLSIMITGGPSQPIIFLFVIPTLYVLVKYIALERKHYEREQQPQ